MPRHHYLPISILAEFVSADAWRLVDRGRLTKEKIALVDSIVIQNEIKRKYPLCVVDKVSNRITRRVAKDVCSQTALYNIHSHKDQITRGLTRYLLNIRLDPRDGIPPTFNYLMNLGKDPIDPDSIEVFYTSRLDAQFASILPKLRSGGILEKDEVDIVFRYVTFARFRTPAWKRVYYPEAYRRVSELLQPLFSKISLQDLHLPNGNNLQKPSDIMDANLYQMAIIEAAEGQFNSLRQLDVKLKVLRTTGRVPFITCDNAARPYLPDRIRRIPTEPLPGLKNPRVQITYPISKTTCILVSSDNMVPLFSEYEISDKQVRRINSALALAGDKELVLPGPSGDFFDDWIDLVQVPRPNRP